MRFFTDDYLAHYGIKGMKWKKRKPGEFEAETDTKTGEKKNIKEWNRHWNNYRFDRYYSAEHPGWGAGKRAEWNKYGDSNYTNKKHTADVITIHKGGRTEYKTTTNLDKERKNQYSLYRQKIYKLKKRTPQARIKRQIMLKTRKQRAKLRKKREQVKKAIKRIEKKG